MCGIVGYIVKDEKAFAEPRQHFLRHALIMDTLRGKDSTGLISIYDKFDVRTARTLASGDRYVNTKQWDKISRDGWCTIGHNRAATLGEVILKNAHPFKFGDVTLVHNGTLEHKGASLPTYDKQLEVDSMQIALALSLHEVDEVHEVLSKVEGAFALVWTDERDGSINMARNSQRPMHFTFNKAETMMMFMSDGHMLTSINKSMWKTHAQGEDIYSLDTHKHLKWKKGSLVPEVADFDPFRRKVEPRIITPTPRKSGTAGGTPLKDRLAATRRARMNSRRGGTSIPKPMVEALSGLYELDVTDKLKFDPEDQWNLSDGTVMVQGTVSLQHWGYTPWPALIYGVPVAQADAYAEASWEVSPIGITRPMSGTGNEPTVLCSLNHCDWKGANLEENKDGTVEGPDGRLVNAKWLDKLTENGCAKCTTALSMHDMSRYAYVNETRDLICEDCKWEECS